MQTRGSSLATRAFLYIRPSINYHGPNIAKDVDERSNIKANFFRVRAYILTRYKDNGGAFTVQSACRNAP